MDNKKYQVSVKLDDGFIYVAHVDTREEFEDEIIYFKGLITNDFNGLTPNGPHIKKEDLEDMQESIEEDKQEANEDFDPRDIRASYVPTVSPSKSVDVSVHELGDKSYCEIHNVRMTERGKDGKKFYSHSKGTYPDLIWCSGKGFKDENAKDSNKN